MKRCGKISLLVLIGTAAALPLPLLFVPRAASHTPSLLIRSVKPPVYIDQNVGSVLLTLTNGSGQDVALAVGSYHVPEIAWLTIERKCGQAWVTDTASQAFPLTPGNASVTTDVIHWPQGAALDVRVPLPADGQPRRITALWKPSLRRVPGVPRRVQSLWWQKVGLRRSGFMETRSPEIVITPGAPRFDLQAATKWLDTNNIQLGSERATGFVDNIGLKYSTSPNHALSLGW